MEPATPAYGAFGQMLRRWRQQRRLSQLALAELAGISARHLCCLEIGRARPSRAMALLLGTALDLPLAELNGLHVAAGFVPPYSEHGLAAPELGHVRQALDFVLRQQEPFPAIVLDANWDMPLRNQAAGRVFGPFQARYDMPAALAGNALHVVFHPGGLRPFMVNWDEFATQMILTLHREAALGHQSARRLLPEILAYPGVAGCRRNSVVEAASPVMTMRLALGRTRLRFFSTLTSFAMPADAALQTLKIECFYPADDATAAHCRNLEYPPP